MEKQSIVLIGAGGHAAVVASTIETLGSFFIVGYTAPVAGAATISCHYNYLGDDSVLPALFNQGIRLAALGLGGTGDNRPRSELYERIRRLGFEFPLLKHPSAVVAPDVVFGAGCVVAPGAIVNSGAKLGINVIVNSGAVVEHDCVIADHVHIATGTVLCGGVRVGRLAHIGAGAVIIQGVTIGEGALVGAGAVVVHDIEPWTVVVGNPAKNQQRI
ncbi:MAG: acetyltransferase [Firmicutes bacterium]|nr:acetyltransferase [Bacillota bacterium]